MAVMYARVEVLREPKEFHYEGRRGPERGLSLWVKDVQTSVYFGLTWFGCRERIMAGQLLEVQCSVRRRQKQDGGYEYSFVIDKAQVIGGARGYEPAQGGEEGEEIAKIPF